MPSLETVESFVQLVEAGQTVQAMHRFYAPAAAVRENMAAARVGKDALIQHETAALASISSLRSRCLRPIFIAGDSVVIRWCFDIEDKKGKTVRLEELAYQRWQDGLIVEEQFFCDPAQLR
jgi:ketosteroid isomerase-like protein